MLDYKLVNYKPLVTRNNETYIDLMGNMFNSINMNSGTFIMVNKHYISRPDLIALAMYGSDDYTDILCKINGISNPFELNENDFLYCPSPDILQNCYKYDANPSDFIESDDENIGKTITTYQKPKNSKRSPNEQTIGETNFVLDKSLGLVFY